LELLIYMIAKGFTPFAGIKPFAIFSGIAAVVSAVIRATGAGDQRPDRAGGRRAG
jgi:hypothetical protein